MLEGADVVWGGRVAAHNGEGTHQVAVLGSQPGVTGVHHPAYLYYQPDGGKGVS